MTFQQNGHRLEFIPGASDPILVMNSLQTAFFYYPDSTVENIIGISIVSQKKTFGQDSAQSLIGNGVGPDWLAEHPRRLAKVTVDEVSAAAAQFFAPSRFVRVVVGDAATVEGPLRRLTGVERDAG